MLLYHPHVSGSMRYTAENWHTSHCSVYLTVSVYLTCSVYLTFLYNPHFLKQMRVTPRKTGIRHSCSVHIAWLRTPDMFSVYLTFVYVHLTFCPTKLEIHGVKLTYLTWSPYTSHGSLDLTCVRYTSHVCVYLTCLKI